MDSFENKYISIFQNSDDSYEYFSLILDVIECCWSNGYYKDALIKKGYDSEFINFIEDYKWKYSNYDLVSLISVDKIEPLVALKDLINLILNHMSNDKHEELDIFKPHLLKCFMKVVYSDEIYKIVFSIDNDIPFGDITKIKTENLEDYIIEKNNNIWIIKNFYKFFGENVFNFLEKYKPIYWENNYSEDYIYIFYCNLKYHLIN